MKHHAQHQTEEQTGAPAWQEHEQPEDQDAVEEQLIDDERPVGEQDDGLIGTDPAAAPLGGETAVPPFDDEDQPMAPDPDGPERR